MNATPTYLVQLEAVVALVREFVDACREDIEGDQEIPGSEAVDYLGEMFHKFDAALKGIDPVQLELPIKKLAFGRTVEEMNMDAMRLTREAMRENRSGLGNFYVTEEEAKRLFDELGFYQITFETRTPMFHGMRLKVIKPVLG